MARLLGPDFISLLVRDIPTSRAFYSEQLGLVIDERFDTPDAVVFDTTTIPFALRAAPPDQAGAVSPGGEVVVWLDCDDVDGLFAELQAAGTTIVRPPFDSPFGRALIFADPDGYRITANQNDWDRFPLGGRQRPS